MGVNSGEAELQQAVADLARDLPRLSTAEACARIGWLRREANARGFGPAAALAAGMSDAVARDRRRAPIGAWIDALATAARCGAGDPSLAAPIFASVAIRYAG